MVTSILLFPIDYVIGRMSRRVMQYLVGDTIGLISSQCHCWRTAKLKFELNARLLLNNGTPILVQARSTVGSSPNAN